MISLPSLHPDSQMAIRDSPLPVNRGLRLTFQQFTLALNVCETVLFLHRPYFARALHARRTDPARTEFGPSYLAVVERSSVSQRCCRCPKRRQLSRASQRCTTCIAT